MKQLLNEEELPVGFYYPAGFKRIVSQGLLDFDPWVILQDDKLTTRFNGIKNRYPSRKLIPFARREDNDDVACWEVNKPGKVIIIHDFASEGFENIKEIESFWGWLRSAVEATIEYDDQ